MPCAKQTVRTWHAAGYSQRAIAHELNMDRRKVKRTIAPHRRLLSGAIEVAAVVGRFVDRHGEQGEAYGIFVPMPSNLCIHTH